MAITKAKKTDQLAKLEALFKEAQGVGFIRFDTLTVEEAQKARALLREQGMSYLVIKKTLMSLAAKNVGLCEFDSNNLEGAVAVIVSKDDEVAPAGAMKKLIKEFNDAKKDVVKFSYAGAIFEGKFLDPVQTEAIAGIPSREESLGRIVGMLKSGPQKMHGVFNSGFQSLYTVLQNADKFAAKS